jgi:hypothetical protein
MPNNEELDLLGLITSELPGDDDLPELMTGKNSADDVEDDEDGTPYVEDEPEDGDEEPDGEPDDGEDETEESEPEPEKVVNKKPASKQDAKIVALKREKKALEEENRMFREQQTKKVTADKITELQAQYESQGYDADTAKIYAEKEVRIANVEERLAVADFREQNADIIARYPAAKDNIAKIMANAKATGMTVEQICRGMFEGAESPSDKRAREAVQGKLPTRDDSQDYAVARSSRAGTQQTSTILGPRDQSLKSQFEKTFCQPGEKISNKEFAAMKKQYGF